MPLARRTAVTFGFWLVVWYIALQLQAKYLLAWVGGAVNEVLWAFMAVTLVAGSYFLLGGVQLDHRWRWLVAILTTFAAGAAILATAALLSNILIGEFWAFTPAANVGWIALFAAEAAALATAGARIAGRPSSV